MKIDNNPFAKGFRETGQSRCKRKLISTSNNNSSHNTNQAAQKNDEESSTDFEQKRLRVISPSAFSAGSLEDSELSTYDTSSNGSHSPVNIDDRNSPLITRSPYTYAAQLHSYNHMIGTNPHWMNFMMPFMNTEAPQMMQNVGCLDNSSSPSTSPAKSVSTSYSDNEESPKKCKFSIAAILGL